MKINAMESDLPLSQPVVDEGNLLSFSKGEYSLRQQVFFAGKQYCQAPDLLFLGHKSPPLSGPLPWVKETSPQVDLNFQTPRLFVTPMEVMKSTYRPQNGDMASSFAIHAALLSFYLLSSWLFKTPNASVEVVEVSFGLTSDFVQTAQKNKPNTPEGQTEATKTIEDLPHLSKHAVPKTAPEQKQQEASKSLVDDAHKPDALVFEEKKKVSSKENKQTDVSQKAPVGAVVEKDKQQITQKDYLKWKEEDLRKVDTTKKAGVHGKDHTKPDGQKRTPVDPTVQSPFLTRDVNPPPSPFAAAPTGSLQGVDMSVYDGYRAYLARELTRHWNLPQASSYSKNLVVEISFVINPYGYLFGNPEILKSSGNADFDRLAMNALMSTFPLSTPPPRSIQNYNRFRAQYSPQGVQ